MRFTLLLFISVMYYTAWSQDDVGYDKFNNLLSSDKFEEATLLLDSLASIEDPKKSFVWNLMKARYVRYADSENRELRLEYLYLAKKKCNDDCSSLWRIRILEELCISLVIGGIEERKRAKSYVNQAIELTRGLNDDDRMASVLITKANSYYIDWTFKVETSEAKTVMHLMDSFKLYLNKADALNISDKFKFHVANSLGVYHLDNGQFKMAEKKFRTCLELDTIILNDHKRFMVQTNLSSALVGQAKFDEARELLDTMWNSSDSKNDYSTKEGIMREYVKLEEAEGNLSEVIKWMEEIGMLHHMQVDSLNAVAMEKYNSAALETQLANEQAKRLRGRLWTTILGGLSVLLLLFAFGVYRFQKFKKREAEIELQNTKIQSALDSTRAEMEGEQKERQMIASELHDQLASSLTAANIHLSLAKKKGNLNESLVKAEDILKDVSSQVRDISHKLVSPALLKFGLAAALDSLVEVNNTDQFKVHLETNFNAQRIDQSKENFLYRSCAELIQNARKHSNGNLIKIILMEIDKKLSLVVEDNGSGHVDSSEINLGLGLANIKNRSEAFGGKFNFERSSDLNTVVEIELPIA